MPVNTDHMNYFIGAVEAIERLWTNGSYSPEQARRMLRSQIAELKRKENEVQERRLTAQLKESVALRRRFELVRCEEIGRGE